VATAIGILAFALPASAGPDPLHENDYEGKVERDPFTYLGFDVVQQGGGKRIARFTAHLAYNCSNGSGGRATARARGKLKVRDGAFAGKLSVREEDIPVRATGARRGAPLEMTYDVSGELRRGGRARGRVDGVIRFEGAPRGTDPFRCYSGRVDWRAERGADTGPKPLPP
jgi:hypothetical protein